MIMQDVSGARAQAMVVMIGLCTFVSVGVAACLALVVGLFYLTVSFVLLVLHALTEMFSSLASVWTSADPLLKVLILAALGYGAYRFYRFRKGG